MQKCVDNVYRFASLAGLPLTTKLNNSLHTTIRLQIERFSGLSFQSLSFPDALEVKFEADTADRRCARLWLEGLFAILLFDLFLIADYMSSPGMFWRVVVVRVGFITPLALIVNISMLYKPNKYYRELSIAVVALLAGLTHLYLESRRSQVVSAYAQLGIVAVVVFANTVMRLRFPYAVTVTGLMVAGDLLFLKTDAYLSNEEKMLGLCLTLGTVVATLISNYSFCREERVNYLLCLQGDVMVGELHQSNAKLQQLAETDALTGLANRHSFDIRITELWNAAYEKQSGLSIILVDVDRFKLINDTYGHLYGDKVLRRIAHLLAEALRRKDDIAVRFGGEEFVVVLPETQEAEATMVAERLRKLVEVAGLPALEVQLGTLGDMTATVSCGVATAYPQYDGGYQELLDAADRALYTAKESGRNCVCCAPSWSFTHKG
jgi:diguanylate cyclase (GGDEF)-like protein